MHVDGEFKTPPFPPNRLGRTTMAFAVQWRDLLFQV